MIEVVAEGAFGDHLLQRTVGRGDDPRPSRPRRVAADPIDLFLLQHTQDLGLGLGRHVADLVEEKRSAVSRLELAGPRLHTGCHTAFDPEELRLEEVTRQGRTIDRHQVLARPRRGLVDEIGQHFLAGSRLAVDHHPHVAPGDAFGLVVDLTHLGVHGRWLRPFGGREPTRCRLGVRRPAVGGRSQQQSRRLDDRAIVVSGTAGVVAGPDLHRIVRSLDPLWQHRLFRRPIRGVEHAFFAGIELSDLDRGDRHRLEDRITQLLSQVLVVAVSVHVLKQTRQVFEGEPVERRKRIRRLADLVEIQPDLAARIHTDPRYADAHLQVVVRNLFDQDDDPTDDEDVTRLDVFTVDPLGAQQRTIGRAQVLELDAIADGEHRVAARDGRIRQTHFTARIGT